MFLRSLRCFLNGLAGLSAAGLLLTSCSSQSTPAGQDVLMHNDFDELTGWLGAAPQPSLTNEKAHSGHYSIKVDANTEFSIGYTKTLGQLSDTRVAKFKIDAWVLIPNAGAKALLVTTFGESGAKPLQWTGFDVTKDTPTNGDWQRVSEVIEVPAAATANTTFNLYLWRTGAAQPIYLDDLTISAVK